MASINLLPWREAARKQQQLNYLTVLAQVAVLAFVLMFFVYWLYQARVEGQISADAKLASAKLVVPALKRAFEDDNVQRVVLYIDSPGGAPVEAERMQRLVSLFTLTFANPAEMRADVAGKPVYLGLATNAEGVVRIKPQNLLLNLPLALQT